MKHAAILMALLCTGFAQGQGAYRWVDQDGKVHYGDRPPSAVAGKAQKLSTSAAVPDKQLSYAVQKAMSDFPVTLYVSADCGAACKDGSNFLRERGIPFSEKNVATKEDVEAVNKLAGGAAMVPLLQVGNRVSKGFESSAWSGLLDAAGYPKEAN
jgi:hypothetical protein